MSKDLSPDLEHLKTLPGRKTAELFTFNFPEIQFSNYSDFITDDRVIPDFVIKQATVPYRYTNWAEALTFDGNVYEHRDIKRGVVESDINTQVDTLVLEMENVAPWFTYLIANIDIRGYTVDIKKVWVDHLDKAANYVSMNEWTIDEPVIGQGYIRLTLKNKLDIITKKCPNRKYQPSCPFRYGDTWCLNGAVDWTEDILDIYGHGVNKYDGTVTTGGSTSQFTDINVYPVAVDWYRWGKIQFTSGDNTGAVPRFVKGHAAGGVISVDVAYNSTIQVGDTFELFRGCNKTFTACEGFVNDDNFGGVTSVPAP